MISAFSAIILGFVEGFTEFLPISSTAHLIIASYVLGLGQTGFVKTFEIAIQSGAILAVIVFFWKKFWDIEMLKRLLVAFIPTAVIGLLAYKVFKDYLLGNMVIVLVSLALGGLILIFFEGFVKKENLITNVRQLSYKKSALIGFAQAIAIIPGVSRSAATIVGGMFLGLSKEAIVEFSFLLAVPTILAATALDLVKNLNAFSLNEMGTLSIGFTVSFLAAIVSIKFLLSYLKNHSFAAFGIYRIILVLVFIPLLFI